MKAAISAQGKHLGSQIDPRFGRSPYFLIIDVDTLDFEAVSNPNVNVVGGAGIQSAQLMIEQGVDLVITGNCGPNAHQALSAVGIQVITGVSGKVQDAIQIYKAGKYQASSEPNVTDHFGLGRGQGMGRGMGRGAGRRMNR